MLTAALAGCARSGDSADLDQALARTRSHSATFRRMEAWVQQVCSVSDCRNDGLGLQETLFAPVRNDRRVHTVWLELGADPPVTMSLPTGRPLPTTSEWARLTEPALGWIRVAAERNCPRPTSAARAPARTTCTWIARDDRSSPRPSPRLVIAFVDPVD